MTDADKKLFDDYNNYIGYSQKFESRICETDKNLCNAWLNKLKKDTYKSREDKLNRNIFLFNLVLCMHACKLVNPFTQDPNDVDLGNPKKYFALSCMIQDIKNKTAKEERMDRNT